MIRQQNRNRVKRIICLLTGQLTAHTLNYRSIVKMEEDDDDDEQFFFLTLERGDAPTRIIGYIENMVSNYTYIQFQQHFRMTLNAFEELLHLIAPQINNDNEQGRSVIDPRKQLLSIIWLLGTPDSYRSVGDRFDMAKSSLAVSFVRVVAALCNIAPQIIKWPERAEMEIIKMKFQNFSHIPGVLGAIDGTYIPIKAPQKDSEVYINRKCFYGITLQAICDPSLKFIDCFAGYPSSVSDVRIFRNSDIYALITTNPQTYFPNDEFIVGDKAYPVLPWLILPYINRGNIPEIQRRFNISLASTRQVIERSFALLKGRFRRLKYLDMNRTDLIPATILASCVLHNVCLHYNDPLLEEYIIEGMDNNNEDEVNAMNPIRRAVPENTGYQKRNELANLLYYRV